MKFKKLQTNFERHYLNLTTRSATKSNKKGLNLKKINRKVGIFEN